MGTRGKLIVIHRDCYELVNSDVVCLSDFRRYIGNDLCWPIPMYYLDIIGSSPICGVNSPLGIFELCN